jgi:hypothetical protein
LRDPAVASDKWVRSPLSDIPEFNTRNNSTSKFDKKSEDLADYYISKILPPEQEHV